MKKDILREKTFAFAVRIVKLHKFLSEGRHERILCNQLLRSGTNPGAMVREAANAETGLDFIHKLAIAQKEMAETQYWLELLHETGYLNETEFNSIFEDTNHIIKLLRSSILTKKQNLNVKNK